MIRVSPSYLVVRLIAIFFCVFVSIYFGGLYSQGDQVFYIEWYKGFGDRDFLEAYNYFSVQINPFEVFYFFPSWLGASFLDKLVFGTIVNVVLVLSFVSVLQKFAVVPLVAVAIVLSSFYLPVLMLAAERLKFGFLAGFLLLLVVHRSSRLFWGFAAVTGHLQMLIPLSALASALAVTSIRIKSMMRSWFPLFVLAGSVGGIIYLLGVFSVLLEYAVYKFDSYAKFDVLELVKPLAFLALSLYCAWAKRRFVVIFFVPIVVAAFFVGSERVTIVAYFAFIVFSSFKSRGLNLANFIVAPYMFFKSLFFYMAIIDTGSGF